MQASSDKWLIDCDGVLLVPTARNIAIEWAIPAAVLFGAK